MDSYDVMIIGAGPAGVFAADELSRNSDLRIAVVERGLDLPERVAIRSGQQPAPDHANVMLEGFGGTEQAQHAQRWLDRLDPTGDLDEIRKRAVWWIKRLAR